MKFNKKIIFIIVILAIIAAVTTGLIVSGNKPGNHGATAAYTTLPGAKASLGGEKDESGKIGSDNEVIPVSDFKAGSGNLVKNPGFETDGGWVAFSGSIKWSNDIVHGGKRSLMLTAEHRGVKLSEQIKLERDRIYAVSLWVNGRANVVSALFGKDGTFLNRYIPIAEGGQPGKWSLLEGILVIDDKSAELFDIEVTPMDDNVFVDDVQVFVVENGTASGTNTRKEIPSKPLKVGAYYFCGWHVPEQWTLIKEAGDREPILGYYRDELPEVQEWHIEQAVQHGISFWIFDWYYDHRTDNVLSNNVALDKGFLNASNREKMQFAVMWCNEENREPDFTEEQLIRMVRTVGERYLGEPNYLRTEDGRNVFAFTRPDRLIAKFGISGTKKVLEAMNEEAKQWGGLFFVGIKYPAIQELTVLKMAGFDACTLYSYNNEGIPHGEKEAPYDTILPTVQPIWEKAMESGVLPIIPCVSPDWDPRPWKAFGGRDTWRTGSTPEKFELMCRTLKEYVDPVLNMIVVGTWNEFGEGSYVEPTKTRGNSYLDAMYRAFFPKTYTPQKLKIPTEEELKRMTFADIPSSEDLMAPKSGNLVANPGFERDFGWVVFDEEALVYSTDNVHSGNRSLMLDKSRGGVKSTTQIDLETGASYKVSAWVNGSTTVKAALFGKDGAWLERYWFIMEGGKPGQWQKLEGTLSIRDKKVAAFDIEFFPESNQIFIDDVEILKQ